MQIHFIWIKEYKTIKEKGINLSSKFIINLEVNDDQLLLNIDFNENYIEDFFKEGNVTDVCAIIGKNGVGKSSILKYVKEHLPRGVNSRIQNDIFVYSSENNYFVEYPESLNLVITNNTAIQFQEKRYNKFRFSTGLANIDYIYYNYLLDFNEDINNYHGLQNISTTSMLLKERKRIIDEIQPREFIKGLLFQNSDLDNLYMQEVYQAIVFLTKMNVELPFTKPESLHLKLDISEKKYFTEHNEKYAEVTQLIEDLEKLTPKFNNSEELFVSNLWFSIFINFLITERKYSSNNPYFHEISLDNIDDRDIYIKRFFETMKGVSFPYSIDGETQQARIPKLDNLSKIVPEFMNLTFELIKRDIIKIQNESEAFFVLDSDSDIEFKKFQDLYVAIRGLTSFIQFRWHSLSSGEQSYLSFMSRFYYLIHEESIRLKSKLVVLIDEGDVGYHPEWQRQFFKNTIEYLSTLFSDKKIQLIFTSNTPFLTSDLPSSNVLFVEKSKDGKSSFLDKQNHNSNTFAANIHTLFSDSFYMNGMLIGEYAKDKINEIIKYLNNRSEITRNESYKKIIDSIGETVLRKKLQDMWFEKFGLVEKLEILKRQVAEVEQKIKDNNDTNSL